MICKFVGVRLFRSYCGKSLPKSTKGIRLFRYCCGKNLLKSTKVQLHACHKAFCHFTCKKPLRSTNCIFRPLNILKHTHNHHRHAVVTIAFSNKVKLDVKSSRCDPCLVASPKLEWLNQPNHFQLDDTTVKNFLPPRSMS